MLALLCVICLCFSGCAVLNSTDLLMLPQISPEQAGLLRLVNEVTANSVWSVTAPVKGDELSSMQFVDIYGDGVEEAVCFFKNPEEMLLRVTVYSTTGPQGYSELCSFETNGYGIDSAKYADLDGDGALELILFVRYESSYIYGAEVYKVSSHSARKVSLGYCAAYTLSDLTLDGRPDVILARRGENGGEAATASAEGSGDRADLFSWKDGVATKLGSAEIIVGDSGTAEITCGMLNPTMSGCVIDVAVTKNDETRWMSNILTWDNGLINLSYSVVSSPLNTSRDIKLLCRDVNFDGNIELPLCISMPSSADSSAPKENYTVWYGFKDGESLVQRSVTYCAAGGNWYYVMPENWYQRVYVKLGGTDGVATYMFTADKNGRPNTLLTIYRVGAGYSPTLPENSFFLAEAGGYTYFALIGVPDELDPLESEMYLLLQSEIMESFVTVDAFGNADKALDVSSDVISVD